MKILLHLLLSFIASTHCQQDPFPEITCTRLGSIRLVPQPSAGAIQICLIIQQNGIFWSYINSNFSETAAQVSCRQLGFLNARAKPTRLTVEGDHWTITTPAMCDGNENRLGECWHGIITSYGMAPVAGLICGCMEGEIRLVAGSTYMEGRIELCSNGIWGTVCGDGWTEREAALVCSRLGYPTLNATLHHFGGGTGPVYNVACQMPETDTSDCNLIITQSSCHHSMDVGVKCLAFTDACADLVNQVITNVETPPACNCQQPTTPTPPVPPPTSMIAKCIPASIGGDNNVTEMSTSNTQPTIGIETLQLSDGPTTESSISQSTVMSTSGTLGALIGLLAAALVVVVTGWIVSCVYFQRKINKKYKDHTHTMSASTSDPTLQLNNPAYGVSTTVPHTTYSSHGPSYEVIDTNEGAANSYDVISHRGGGRPQPHTTPPVSNEEYSTLDTSRENHYYTLECNTGDGQYSMVRQTDPQNDRPDPQDYEVPAPLQGEEYSTLKH